MDIETVAVLTVWGWKNRKSYVKQVIICEDWDKAKEIGMKFDDTTTIDDGFEDEEQLKNYIEELRKGEGIKPLF